MLRQEGRRCAVREIVLSVQDDQVTVFTSIRSGASAICGCSDVVCSGRAQSNAALWRCRYVNKASTRAAAHWLRAVALASDLRSRGSGVALFLVP
nr:hypothetical protein CFP56_56977 [Quercus suber]